MYKANMPYEAQNDLVESFDHHKDKNASWYFCSSCNDYIEHMVEYYGIKKIEYIINAYENGLLETKYTRDSNARYGYSYPIYLLGERITDLFNNE